MSGKTIITGGMIFNGYNITIHKGLNKALIDLFIGNYNHLVEPEKFDGLAVKCGFKKDKK